MRLALVFVLTTLVATCGQKGPLELPGAPSDGRADSSNTQLDSTAGPSTSTIRAFVLASA